MVVHNADGSIAEMCGNGLRCAVKHLVDRDPARPSAVAVETGAGRLTCQVSYQGGEAARIEVAMGPARVGLVDAEVAGHPGLRATEVSMGNPHLVLSDAPLEEAPLLGPVLERHPDFPARTNVEFVRSEGAGLRVVVWERGCGLTLACGTGACAAVAAWVRRGALPAGGWTQVLLPGGALEVWVAADFGACSLRGPAAFVFEAVVPWLPGR
jgi:diaminopimelate epimerase